MEKSAFGIWNFKEVFLFDGGVDGVAFANVVLCVVGAFVARIDIGVCRRALGGVAFGGAACGDERGGVVFVLTFGEMAVAGVDKESASRLERTFFVFSRDGITFSFL